MAAADDDWHALADETMQLARQVGIRDASRTLVLTIAAGGSLLSLLLCSVGLCRFFGRLQRERTDDAVIELLPVNSHSSLTDSTSGPE